MRADQCVKTMHNFLFRIRQVDIHNVEHCSGLSLTKEIHVP